MRRQVKAILNHNGSRTILNCSPEVAIDGQKVILVRATGEQIRGRVSGRDLGVKETLLGVGRVKDGLITIETSTGPVSVEIHSESPKLGYRKGRFGLKNAGYMKAPRSKHANDLILKAVKD